MTIASDHHDAVHSVAQYALFILQDEFGDGVRIISPQKFELPAGSTKAVVEVDGIGPYSLVLVAAPVVLHVEPTLELFEFVARQGGKPGLAMMLVVDSDTEGLVNVLMAHHIYGNCLDRSELLTSVANVAGQADDADEDMVSRFGGHRFADG